MKWTGGLVIGNGWALYHGRAGDSELHAHYAAQLVCSEKAAPAAAIIENVHFSDNVIYIPSTILHRLEPNMSALDILYAEPLLLKTPHGDAAHASEREQAITLYETLRASQPDDNSATLLASTASIADTRIKSAIDVVEQYLDGPIYLSEIAQASGLSRSRFAELFRAETRLPLRQFVLWRRLRRAILAVSEGENATGAAYAAGFSDAAHFSRTVRAMFGIAPTDILSGVKVSSRTSDG